MDEPASRWQSRRGSRPGFRSSRLKSAICRDVLSRNDGTTWCTSLHPSIQAQHKPWCSAVAPIGVRRGISSSVTVTNGSSREDLVGTNTRGPVLVTSIPIVDAVLDRHATALGHDFIPYRNHVYRVVNLCLAVTGASRDGLDKIAVAAAFHDLGIWTDHTFDYIAPVSYTHLRAHETGRNLVCRLLLEKK